MQVLAAIPGYQILFDEQAERLNYDPKEIACIGVSAVRLNEINQILLNSAVRYPTEVYYSHKHVIPCQQDKSWPEPLRYEVNVIPVGLLGIEYLKTHVFATDNQQTFRKACVVEVLSGKLVVLMQKNLPRKDAFDIEVRVEEFNVVYLNSGDKLAIPVGYLYTFVNAETRPVVFSRLVGTEHLHDYKKHMQKVRGLAYYAIAKNARMELVRNPRYREIPQAQEKRPTEVNSTADYASGAELCLFDEVCTAPGRFTDLYLTT